MRDSKRIKRILKKFEKIWLTRPDLRFGQLVLNTLDNGMDLYYVEDNFTEGVLNLIIQKDKYETNRG